MTRSCQALALTLNSWSREWLRPTTFLASSMRISGRRLVQLLHGRFDVSAAGLDRLHVQTPSGDHAVAHDEDRDSTHHERRSVQVVTVPVPFAPLGVSVHRCADKL